MIRVKWPLLPMGTIPIRTYVVWSDEVSYDFPRCYESHIQLKYLKILLNLPQ